MSSNVLKTSKGLRDLGIENICVLLNVVITCITAFWTTYASQLAIVRFVLIAAALVLLLVGLFKIRHGNATLHFAFFWAMVMIAIFIAMIVVAVLMVNPDNDITTYNTLYDVLNILSIVYSVSDIVVTVCILDGSASLLLTTGNNSLGKFGKVLTWLYTILNVAVNVVLKIVFVKVNVNATVAMVVSILFLVLSVFVYVAYLFYLFKSANALKNTDLSEKQSA